MNLLKPLASLSCLFVVLSWSAQNASAVILQSDNFDDNSINAGLWSTNVSRGPSASVTETNQRIQFSQRGYLTSVGDFKPSDYNTGAYTGGIKVTGTWKINDVQDNANIVTRSDGVPNSSNAWDATNGIVFVLSTRTNQLQIYRQLAGVPTTLWNQNVAGGFSSQTGTFDFTIIDDGNNVSFSVTDLGNGNVFTATAAVSNVYSTNKVSFYNREAISNGAYLDNVVIQANAIPEPSSLILVGMAGTALLAIGRRSRRGLARKGC